MNNIKVGRVSKNISINKATSFKLNNSLNTINDKVTGKQYNSNSDNTNTYKTLNTNIETTKNDVEMLDLGFFDFIKDLSNKDKLEKCGITLSKLQTILGVEDLKISDIISVEECGVHSENRKITVSSPEGDLELLFVPKNGEFALSFIKYSDGTTISTDIPEDQMKLIKDSIHSENDVKITGYSIIDIDGRQFRIYRYGEGRSLSQFKQIIDEIKKELSIYPPNVLDYIIKDGNFKGFFIGAPTDAPDSNMASQNGWAAYAHGSDRYIYVSTIYRDQVIKHEFGHTLDQTLGEISYKQPMLRFFDKYKKLFQEAFDDRIGYVSSAFPDGIPYPHEFFAEVMNMYVEFPDEVEALFPDLFEYIDGLIKSL